MRRIASAVLAAAVMTTSAHVVYAQVDAKAAFDSGKQAYAAGLYDKAAAQFTIATQTDNKNPEAFLWLGKSDYQLGKIDLAMAAWTRTLQLAPDEPYATKMIVALRSELSQPDSSMAVIDVLLAERLWDPAMHEADKVLANKAITEAQRVRAAMQKASALVGAGRAAEAPAILYELTVKYPKTVDAAQASLLLGQAYLKAGGDKTADGLALLRKAAADNGNAIAAATAKLELILYELSLGVTVERAEALSQWLLANPKHPQATAIARFATIVADLEKLGTDAAITKAAGLQGQLLAGLSVDSPLYPDVLHREVDLLDNIAQRVMAENQRTGNGAKNEKLSDTQKLIIDLLARRAARLPDASKAIERLDAHLRNWITAGYFATAEEGFTLLGQAVAPSQQRMVRLAVIRVWTAQVLHNNERMQAAGFTPAHQLDATLGKALRELYSLQAGLAETDQQLFEVRRHWTAIVTHYRRMEWFDVAEQAIAVKADAAVPAADAHALLTLAGLREAQARADFDRTAKQLDAAKKLALTPGFRSAIETYQKFITTFPANPNTTVAANAILDIGRLYEQRGAFDVAVEVYRGLATFAAGQKSLAASTPNTAGMADHASLAAAAALDAKARQALAKWATERKADTAPPAKLSDEYAAALNAYKDFLKTRSASPLAGTATAKIQAAALEYAKVDGWDVADGIYADLLAAGLPLKSPERIELARAMCILGKVMPQDAIDVLTRLSQGAELKPSARPAVLETSVALLDDLRKQREEAPAQEALAIEVPKPGVAGRFATRPGDDADLTKIGAGTLTLTGSALAVRGTAADSDIAALAAVTQNETRRAAQVAALRDGTFQFGVSRGGGGGGGGRIAPPDFSVAANGPAQQPAQQMDQQGQARAVPAPPVLSEAELARITGVFDNAYKAFAALRLKYPTTTVADLARAEMLAMVNHWRTLAQWQRGAALGERYVGDYLTDIELPRLRLQIARDYLSYATLPPKPDQKRQEAMAELGKRFDKARVELKRIVDDFADKLDLVRDAQWDIAASFLAQARTVDGLSPTLSRGQYVRAARELQKLARQYAEHPRMAEVPQLLAQIAAELSGRGHAEEAIIVWQDLVNFDPTHALSHQSGPLIASTYQSLNRPLKAVETWMEVNFARGGNDQAAQNAIFQIGTQLKNEKRWAEALGVLETFVDSFPKHASAGQALTMIGQIHQANEAWEDAIAAYKRVINEFPSGNWIQEAKWAIAECTINLSQWREAIASYESFTQTYPQDPKVAEANRRIGILKDLARYQTVVDEPGQRKNFDAQYQIGTIIQTQLSNPQKAIIEFRKVATNYPKSHLAPDALHAIGTIYLGIGETRKAREALNAVATLYPDSHLADDALVLVGRSFEDEAQKLTTITRGTSVALAQDQAQKDAYRSVQSRRLDNKLESILRLKSAKGTGKADVAELEEARQAGSNQAFNTANFELAAQKAIQDVETLSAVQMADRQDRINAALRKAIEAYTAASKVPGADKAGDALLRMAAIYDEQLKNSALALATRKEIVNQFSGTAIAEDAAWRIALYYERAANYAEAVEAYKAFLRNYRRSPNAAQSQISIAECFEHLNKWIEAMEAYTSYINSFPEGPAVAKAREQINWIKTYRL